jgi:hypothetical protein
LLLACLATIFAVATALGWMGARLGRGGRGHRKRASAELPVMRYDEDDGEHTYLGLPGGRMPFRRIVVDDVDGEHEAFAVDVGVAPERPGRGQVALTAPAIAIATGLRREQRDALRRRLDARVAETPLLDVLRLPGLRRETPAIVVAELPSGKAWQIATVGPTTVYRLRNGQVQRLTEAWAPTVIEGHRLVEAVLITGRAMRGDTYLATAATVADGRGLATLLASGETAGELAARICARLLRVPCVVMCVSGRGASR